jgi:TRAP-type uncharacterized transport system substrate-binding protein
MAKTSSRFRSRRRPGIAAALLVSLCAAACSSGSAAPRAHKNLRAIAVWVNTLDVLVRRDSPFQLISDLVYQLTREFFAQLPALARDHGEAALIDPEQAPAAPIPQHARAARYYREREVLG